MQVLNRKGKKMSKQKSIVIFLLSIVCTVAMCLVCVYGVNYKGMNKGSAKNITLGLDLQGGVSITFQVVGDTPTDKQMSDTIYKIQLRANEYSTESEVYQEGDNRITVEIPGEDDAEEVLKKLGNPGSLEFVSDYGKTDEKIWLSGTDVTNAEAMVVTDGTYNTPYVVSLHLSDEGIKKFADATGNCIGESLYIVYDDEVISDPYVSEQINSDSAVITGMASLETAEELAAMIRIGSLDVELETLTSKVVGAKLGEDAISTSLKAALIGTFLVMIFMTIVYRVPGFASAIALVAYIALELLSINGFNWTLTLPGIAGIILSIGMAVDANVIIFARIKEELAEGVTVKSAIKIGFQKATSAIVDGNVTTLIAAIILMILGSGPVKGFAQTLALGIVLSMFTAMVVTRVLVYCLYYMGFDKVPMYGVAKDRKSIDFLKKKNIFIGVSAIVILIGFVALGVNHANKGSALNYSVEFKGGVSTTVDFKENYDISEFNDTVLQDIIKIKGDSDVLANAVKGTNQYVIRTQELDESVFNDIKAMLVKDYGAIEDSFETVDVSSTISGEMTRDAIIAVIVSVICILIYIAFRFHDIRFASSAVIALVHDILVVLAFYALSWTTVGNTFIACMLTILGYSINATIVIFDRIRENLPPVEYDEDDNPLPIRGTVDTYEIANRSITQTLTRTMYSTFTTFLTIFVLYILGVPSIKEFALPLIVGILAGGYSSACITSAIWYMMSKKKYNVK